MIQLGTCGVSMTGLRIFETWKSDAEDIGEER